jgi:hypothetical protein
MKSGEVIQEVVYRENENGKCVAGPPDAAARGGSKMPRGAQRTEAAPRLEASSGAYRLDTRTPMSARFPGWGERPPHGSVSP